MIGFSSTSAARAELAAQIGPASFAGLDVAFARSLRAATPDELQSATSEIHCAFASNLPYIPVLTPNNPWVWSRTVSGFAPSSMRLCRFRGTVRLVADTAEVARK